MANPSHINFTQNLLILFSKHIYGEYPLHLYTDFGLMHSFVEKVVDNLLFIHTESHFIHKVIHICQKLWINIPQGLDKKPIIYSVLNTVYIVLYFYIFVVLETFFVVYLIDIKSVFNYTNPVSNDNYFTSL